LQSATNHKFVALNFCEFYYCRVWREYIYILGRY